MGEAWGIILAAGASERMKTNKMLLPYRGKTVLETVIENAVSTLKNKVLVVLGAKREEIMQHIGFKQVKYLFNDNYNEGMLSSVICGISDVPDEADAALIILGDQPQISTEVIDEVISAWQQSGKGIIIPVFNGKRGHPVLIEKRYHHEIKRLDPEAGLRSLYGKFAGDIYEVECGTSSILRDLDTPDDYRREINQIN